MEPRFKCLIIRCTWSYFLCVTPGLCTHPTVAQLSCLRDIAAVTYPVQYLILKLSTKNIVLTAEKVINNKKVYYIANPFELLINTAFMAT